MPHEKLPACGDKILNISTFIIYLLSVQIVLRIISEILIVFARKTENKFDNKVAQFLTRVSFIIGSVIGVFGFGTPPFRRYKKRR